MESERTPTGLIMGYARVSTLEQDESMQRDALAAAGCDRLFVDKASGKLESRPALDHMLDHLRPGDTVVIWQLDRLGRSLRHLIDIFADLDNRGVAVRSLTESIDTSTPGGRLVFHVFGALAEFERDLIRERTWQGSPPPVLAAGAAVGRASGRRRSCRRPRPCTAAASTTWPPSPGSWGSAEPRCTAVCRRRRSVREGAQQMVWAGGCGQRRSAQVVAWQTAPLGPNGASITVRS